MLALGRVSVPLLRFPLDIMIKVRSMFMFSKSRMAITTETLFQSDDKDSDEMQSTRLDTCVRTFSCGYIHIVSRECKISFCWYPYGIGVSPLLHLMCVKEKLLFGMDCMT